MFETPDYQVVISNRLWVFKFKGRYEHWNFWSKWT